MQSEQKRGYLIVLLAALAYSVYPAGSRLAYAHAANPTFLILVTTAIRTAALFIAALGKGVSLREICRGIPGALGSGFFSAHFGRVSCSNVSQC